MNAEQGLLQAILNEPEADDLRLIYADVLEDSDPARSELIRLQCELASLDSDAPERAKLSVRIAELLIQHRQRWANGLNYMSHGKFKRGFLHRCCVNSVNLSSSVPHFEQTPIDECHLVCLPDQSLETILAFPHLSRLRKMHFWRLNRTEDFLYDLADLPRLCDLALDQPQFTGGEVRGLALLFSIPSIQHLSLQLGSEIQERALPLPESQTHLQSLALDISGALSLVRRLQKPLALPHLTRLNISGGICDSEWANAWQSNLRMENLVEMNLNLHSIESNYVGHLLSCVGPQLRRLTLSAWDMNRPLYGLPLSMLRKLTTLEIRGLSHDDLARLSRLEGGSLRTLDLSNNNLTSESIQLLADSPVLSTVHRLILKNNLIGDDGVEALARSRHLSNLRVLSLSKNRITCRGLEALAESISLSNLIKLDLAKNRIQAKGIEALCRWPVMPRLCILELDKNKIGDRGAIAIANGPHFQLRYLGLRENQIRQGGASKVVGSEHHPHLMDVRLSRNGVGKELPKGGALSHLGGDRDVWARI